MKDLKIHIVNHTSKTRQIVVFLAGGSLTAPWAYPHIAPQAKFDITLPGKITISAASDVGSGRISTRELPIDSNNSFDIIDNDGALDIQTAERETRQGVTSIINRSHSKRYIFINRGGRCVGALRIAPNDNYSLLFRDKLGLAIMNIESGDFFFDPETIDPSPIYVNPDNNANLFVSIEESQTTGLAEIRYTFER